MLNTPVVLLIYRRPEPTRRVFEAIAAAKPQKLFVVADGPRLPTDVSLCRAARDITEMVDWPCEQHRHYSDDNMGCKRRVISGLDWVFAQCDEAIILEDDCVPHPTFFDYCQQLLDFYRDDHRVFSVCGAAFFPHPAQYSYTFSRYPEIWGWATWKRAWQTYDADMSNWCDLRKTDWLYRLLGSRPAARFWREVFDSAYAGDIDTWDYQWIFSSWLQGALAAIPNTNLVTNVGFGPDATHTRETTTLAHRPASPIELPLRHPPEPVADRWL